MSLVLLKYAERDQIIAKLCIESIKRKMQNKEFVSLHTVDFLNDLIKNQKRQKREYTRRLNLVKKMSAAQISIEVENAQQTFIVIDKEIEDAKKHYSE